jgi:uncharacterized membrane protein
MNSNLLLVLAVAIGVIAGLRALTAPATVSWIAHFQPFSLAGSHLSWMGSIIAVVIFTIAALAEIVNDKLPKTPPRTAPPSIVIRMVMGALAAATLGAAAGGSIALTAILGAVGALIGTFGGYQFRTKLVAALKCPDFVIALLEDVIAVAGGLFIASRL